MFNGLEHTAILSHIFNIHNRKEFQIFNYTYNILFNEFITNLWVEKKVPNVSLYIFTPVRNVPI